jgi:4'-phosphopantetheinyl transferase
MAGDDRLSLGRTATDPSEVHVWASFAGSTRDGTRDEALLDGSERARAQRFRFTRDRARFVHRHAFVRRVLARYLGADPAAVSIRTSSEGKPRLDPAHGTDFSVSQADDLTVVAVAHGRSVGIDVERIQAIDDAAEIAAACFTKLESDHLRSLPRASRPSAFLRLWTRKESFVKAIGTGLSMPLDSFVVVDEDGSGVGRPHGAAGVMPFVISPIAVPHGYVGAVTLQGDRIDLRVIDEAKAN